VSVDTTFKPIGATYTVSTSAIQVGGSPQSNPGGISTYRVRSLTANGYISWGSTSAVTATAPAVGSPQMNTMGMTTNQVEHFEIPYGSWFIGTAAFEVTPGIGGT